MNKYYMEGWEEVLQEVQSSPEGLSNEEAAARLEKNGKNKLKEAEKGSLARKFINSLADPMIIMLIVAAAIQAVVTVLESAGKPSFGDFADVVVILVVVVINTIMSLVQESKAEAAMEALMQMTAATSKVLRDGKQTVLKSEDIVVGDVVVFEAGDAVPADCRILESYSMKAEEAALTGESVPVSKVIDVMMLKEGKEDIPLGDRKNMLYSGSTVVYGRGTAVVTATGMDTEMGKIAEALTEAEKEQTPLQKKMAELSRFLTKLVLGICVVVFAVGLIEAVVLSDEPFSWSLLGSAGLNTFIAAIALAVAAIPEGLPAVVTIILSIGVTAMSKRQALIRKLTAVETLGCTQIICSDKTGTLTQNRMTVVDTFTDDPVLLAKAMACCSDAKRSLGMHEAVGEPTEAALVNHAHDLKLYKDELDENFPRIGEAPFDSMRKMMSTVHQEGDRIYQYTKGATEIVLERCNYVWRDGKAIPITDEYRKQVKDICKQFADRALRVLGAAYRPHFEMPKDFEAETLEQDMVFIGCLGMIDPCRPEVYDAIEECRQAGIRPIMITGDHKDTAVAIARELGILDPGQQAITGAELDAIDEATFAQDVRRYSVYARVQPENKVRIVKAWQGLGCVTAMTGDGVNDAPSIKQADIGVGMGITGTDVTKSVADMILTDDNFATIVSAVAEGRRIYDNIRKAIQYLLSANLAEVLAVFAATLMGFTIFKPVHILWINLITDTFPAIALGMEAAEPDTMRRPPRRPEEGIFAGGMAFDMCLQGLVIAALTVLSYFTAHRMSAGSWAIAQSPEGMTMAFLTLSMTEIFHAFNMRTRHGSLLSEKTQNRWLWLTLVFSLLMTTLVVFVPFLRDAFSFAAITLREYAVSMGIALCIIPIVELFKLLERIAARRKA